MKYCSLCSKEYGDEIKNCELSHCVSCGYTRLWSNSTRTLNPMSVIFVVGFFIFVLSSIILEVGGIFYAVIGMMAVMMGWTISSSFHTEKLHLCLNCLAKGFTPIKNAKLQDHNSDSNKQEMRKITTQEIIDMTRSSNTSLVGTFNQKSVVATIGLIVSIIALFFREVIQNAVDSFIG